MRLRALLASAVLAATASPTLVPAFAATPPKPGAACAAKDVGKRNGSLVCTKQGAKSVWRAAPATSTAPTAAAAATTVAAVTTVAAPRTIRPVTVSIAAAFTSLPLLVSQQYELDKKHGIDMKAVTVASGADLARGILSGDIKIGLNSPPNVIALADQGADVVMWGKTLNTSNFDLVVRADVPTPNAGSGWIGVMKDLAGKRIGVVARGVAAEEIVKSMFRVAGVDPDKQTYIATGLAPTTLAALTNKAVDAAFNVEPTISLAVQQGLGKAPFALRRGDGPDVLKWPGVVLNSQRDWVKANADIAKDFMDMYAEAVKWVYDPANKDALYKLMADKLGADAALADVMLRDNAGAFAANMTLSPKEVQAMLDWANLTGSSLQRRKPADILLAP